MQCIYTYERELELASILNNHIINEEELIAFIENENNIFCERLNKYYLLFMHNRRLKNYQECFKLYTKYKDVFKDEFLYKHLYASVLREDNSLTKIKQSVKISKELLEIEPNHPGSFLNIAIGYLLITEKEDNKVENINRLRFAIEYIDNAIKINPNYPKYLFIKAQILNKQKKYTEALDYISQAITLEDSKSKNYNLKMIEYITLSSKINIEKNADIALKKVQDNIHNTVNNLRKESIQILSFFIALIAFVMQGANIATNFTVIGASQYILIVFSALILILIAFQSIFLKKSIQKSNLTVAIIIIIIMLIIVKLIPTIINDNSSKIIKKKISLDNNTSIIQKK